MATLGLASREWPWPPHLSHLCCPLQTLVSINPDRVLGSWVVDGCWPDVLAPRALSLSNGPRRKWVPPQVRAPASPQHKDHSLAVAEPDVLWACITHTPLPF